MHVILIASKVFLMFQDPRSIALFSRTIAVSQPQQKSITNYTIRNPKISSKHWNIYNQRYIRTAAVIQEFSYQAKLNSPGKMYVCKVHTMINQSIVIVCVLILIL